MGSRQIAAALIGGLALVGVGVGLWLTGGPEMGRAEQRDAERLSDLERLAEFVQCVADKAGETLPARLAPDPACDVALAFTDPVTGAPYRYELHDMPDGAAPEFTLCASFELPERVRSTYMPQGDLDRTTGCARMVYLGVERR